MALYNGLDRARHFEEFGTPLVSAAGVISAATRKATALANLGLTATAAEINALAAAGVDGTEFGYLNDVTAGQFPAASKAVVAGSDGFVPTRRHIIADGAALVLSAADSGGLIVMDKTDGSLSTLPEITASNIGMEFEFLWTASYASGTQKIITGAATDLILGTINKFDTDTLTDPLSQEAFNGSTHIAVVIDAVTDGGLIGSRLKFTAVSATTWAIEGMLNHSGNVSASVSTT